MKEMSEERRPRKPGDLDKRLDRIMSNLVRACRSFDSESEIEAGSIASKLRTLLHHKLRKNGSGSHSLLVQLNFRDQWQFVDTGVRRDDYNRVAAQMIRDPKLKIVSNSPSDTGLVIPAIVKDVGKFIAPLSRNRFGNGHPMSASIVPYRDFKDWWTTPFIETLDGPTFSRMNIVMTMANQEDSHIDPEINSDFDDLYHDSHGLSIGINGGPLQSLDPNIIHATIRQVAYEVMATIDENLGSDWVIKTGNLREKWEQFPMAMTILG